MFPLYFKLKTALSTNGCILERVLSSCTDAVGWLLVVMVAALLQNSLALFRQLMLYSLEVTADGLTPALP